MATPYKNNLYRQYELVPTGCCGRTKASVRTIRLEVSTLSPRGSNRYVPANSSIYPPKSQAFSTSNSQLVHLQPFKHTERLFLSTRNRETIEESSNSASVSNFRLDFDLEQRVVDAVNGGVHARRERVPQNLSVLSKAKSVPAGQNWYRGGPSQYHAACAMLVPATAASVSTYGKLEELLPKGPKGVPPCAQSMLVQRGLGQYRTGHRKLVAAQTTVPGGV
eukprot:186288-Rhodomonas_salina.1